MTCIYSLKKIWKAEFVTFLRDSKSNNKYSKFYDPKQELKHKIYLDQINVYGYAMSNIFPIGGSKWIDPKNFDSNKYSSNSLKGCL